MDCLRDYDSGEEPNTMGGEEDHSKSFPLELNPSEIDPILHSEVSMSIQLGRP